MSKSATMTIEDCEAELGSRGNVHINSINRGAVRKWLVAKGFPALFVGALSMIELGNAYNKTDDSGVAALDRKWKAVEADGPIDIDPVVVASPISPQATPKTNGHAFGDPANQLVDAIERLVGNRNQGVDVDAVNKIVDARLNDALAGIATVRIELAKHDGSVVQLDGHHHPMFHKLLKVCSARLVNGYAPNVWLAGPAGSGKTHAAHKTAEALGVTFYHNGALSMAHELLGFIDAAGNYHTTQFRQAYELGGVYCFDEVDGSDNAALLALNAALANGACAFPDKTVTRHKDCVIIATANTWGLGATADYVGRAKIDAAFLSRFAVKLPWDYDEALEIAISGDAKFAARVIAARAKARGAGLKVLIDPRASQAGSALVAAGFTYDEAAELTYLANLSSDQRKLIER
jgi:hypothetical protein